MNTLRICLEFLLVIDIVGFTCAALFLDGPPNFLVGDAPEEDFE